MEYYFIPATKFNEWLNSFLTEFVVYASALEEDKQHFRLLTKEYLSAQDKLKEPIRTGLAKIRSAESLKGFFFTPREIVSKGFKEHRTKDVRTNGGLPLLIIGAKNCDLMPLQVLKKMFLEGKFVDPFYQDRVSKTTIISADCPTPETTCFCNLLGLTPFPTTGSDINLTVLSDGYLLCPLTERGKELIASRPNFSRPAREEEISAQEEQREKAQRTLVAINPKPFGADLAEAVEKMKDNEFWQEHAKTCIECFGCLMTCPTCFCYLLYDQGCAESESQNREIKNYDFIRTKIWDACYYPAYARVAGGMNPRAEFLPRFINRFHCKFMNFYRDHNFYACSGCGRCLSVCSGKIDIRKILLTLSSFYE